MPRARRQNIGRRTRSANRMLSQRRSQSVDDLSQQNELRRERYARNSSAEPQRPRNPARPRQIRRRVLENMRRAAFNYDPQIDYSMHGYIGLMGAICPHCEAAKFLGETAGMCCANGKVKLPAFETPPDPLHSLIFGGSPTSKHFMNYIQEYNSSFQMTSFGATKIIRDNFMPTFKVITSCGISNCSVDLSNNIYNVFKDSDLTSNYIAYTLQIQGQIYHRAGALLPFPDANHQFLQIYFIGDENRELNERCTIGSHTRREIICDLQRFFHQSNELVQLFKTALDRMPSDNHKIIIRADKTHFG